MEEYHEDNKQLTSGEIGCLWQTYQHETLSICGIKFFLQHIDDKEIEVLLEKALGLSEKRIAEVKKILHEENHPIPEGFTEGDVNLKAPRIFSDELYLEYLLQLMQLEFFIYDQAMLVMIKWPLQQFYAEVMQDTMTLEMEAKELSKAKGQFIREATIPPLKHVSYIKQDSFLTGWFGNRRPLMALEISQLVYNAKRNALGAAVITAFSQVAKDKEVREFFIKGIEIAEKHIQKFTEKLGEEYLPHGTLGKTDQVTTSTEAPFSDKLMMTFITTLIGSGLGEYGLSMSMSPRHDLGAMYTRLMAEIAVYSNNGEKMMIDNAWMEQPPMAVDRKELSKKNNE